MLSEKKVTMTGGFVGRCWHYLYVGADAGESSMPHRVLSLLASTISDEAQHLQGGFRYLWGVETVLDLDFWGFLCFVLVLPPVTLTSCFSFRYPHFSPIYRVILLGTLNATPVIFSAPRTGCKHLTG